LCRSRIRFPRLKLCHSRRIISSLAPFDTNHRADRSTKAPGARKIMFDPPAHALIWVIPIRRVCTAGTKRKLAGPLSRELRALPLVALLIDGVHFARACGPGNSGVDDRAPNRSWDCAKSRPTTPRRCWSSRRIGGTRFRSREFASDRNENLFGRVCRIGRRVSHCRSGTMPLDRSGCWKQSAVPQGDLAFAMPALIAALHAPDTSSARPGVEQTEKAA
jgi:hypothetical protein